ncbi:MAG: M20 family metallopeptidase [Acidobacteria bacterium]|nr:M20 family metallopeptidase [Acidobacteriota bacterium]
MLRHLQNERAAMVRLLGEFVRVESPSFDKAAVDQFGKILAAEWRRVGAKVQILRSRERGNHVRAEMCLGAGRPAGQILVLGHLDTVYGMGTLRRSPFRVSKGRAMGPGTVDMKSGLVIALHAAKALKKLGIKTQRRLVFLWTSDEEIGSYASRATIEREARRSDYALVLEPATGQDGRLKTARKGVGEVQLQVTGHAAHAGVNPKDGVNAVHELALQIAWISGFNDSGRGISVNADVVSGGTRSNVIAEQATALIDLRVAHRADMALLGRKFRALRPMLPGARLHVRGGVDRPPMERTPAIAAMFRQARSLANTMGFRLMESSTGGGSDGNLTAALGVPTLDGLGGVGGGAHTPEEFVFVDSLPQRAALLAALLATL